MSYVPSLLKEISKVLGWTFYWPGSIFRFERCQPLKNVPKMELDLLEEALAGSSGTFIGGMYAHFFGFLPKSPHFGELFEVVIIVQLEIAHLVLSK